MRFRKEHDTMGEVEVPSERHYGAQTARSLMHFSIGEEKMPVEVLRALILLKRAAAVSNETCGRLSHAQSQAIIKVCDMLVKDSENGINPAYAADFPLHVWQTGSGTQSNMNVNEVIAHLANEMLADEDRVHPNDHVNASQSSNDTFPTAMHVAAYLAIRRTLLPAMEEMISVLQEKEEAYRDVIKIGRTHLMDAVPITFGQEISGWRTMMEACAGMIRDTLPHLSLLAIGATAVGTSLNCPEGFAKRCCEELSALCGKTFVREENGFHALSAKDAFVHTHGALKALASDLMKIAGDVRLLASGPRAGLSEITIPANEPGSSIMPGKVNPTQCEALTMIAAQVMGNDVTVGVGASLGQFQLNVFMPVLSYNMMQSIRLLADGIRSFTDNCLTGLKANTGVMEDYVSRSLMLVTSLSPVIGYEAAAKAAHLAHETGCSLKEAVMKLDLMSEEDYDRIVRPGNMV